MHRSLHLIAFVLHAVSCILSFVGDNGDQERHVYVLKTDYIENATITTMRESVGRQNVLVWIFLNELFTALSHAIACVFYYMYSLNDQEKHQFELMRRSIEYSITAAILPVALALSITDIALQDVVFVFTVNAVIQILGFTEKRDLMYPAFMLLAAELTYVCILFVGADYSHIENPVFYQQVVVFYVLFYLVFGLVKVFNIRNKYEEDKLYIVLSVSCKISISWLLIGNVFNNFLAVCKSSNTCNDVKSSIFYFDWFGVQIGLIVFGCLGLLWTIYTVYTEKIWYESVQYEVLPKQNSLRF